VRYGTWNIDFSANDSEGTTPLRTLGVFMISPTKIAGYIPADENIALLSGWGTVEITASDFLALALVINPLATMVDGLLKVPTPVEIAAW
jgi:hypothetical protein